MASTRLRPTPKRNYLYIAAIALLGLIGTILVYRAFTGTTIKDQRAVAEAKKAAEELQSLPPGNAESLSAKLEAARLEAEKQREAQAQTERERAPAAASAEAPAPSADAPARAAQNPAPAARGGASSAGAGFDLGLPSDEELEAYERNKTAQGAGVPIKPPTSSLIEPGRNAKNGADGTLASSLVGLDLQRMQAAGLQGSGQSPASQTGLPPALAAQISALLQAQGQGGAGAAQAASQGQFRDQLAAGAQKAPEVLRSQAPSGPASRLVLEGTSIPVSMSVDVSSDIQGKCTARVAQDVLDSITLSRVLIPAGSRLICTYDEGVVQGQDKLLLAFTRLILPDGSFVSLVDMEAADRFGATGAPAKVNSRFWSIFGSSFVIAAVTRLAEPKQSSTGGVTINTSPGASNPSPAATVLAETSKKVLERNLNVKPELRLFAGDYLRLTVTRDMVIDPVFSQR